MGVHQLPVTHGVKRLQSGIRGGNRTLKNTCCIHIGATAMSHRWGACSCLSCETLHVQINKNEKQLRALYPTQEELSSTGVQLVQLFSQLNCCFSRKILLLFETVLI